MKRNLFENETIPLLLELSAWLVHYSISILVGRQDPLKSTSAKLNGVIIAAAHR